MPRSDDAGPRVARPRPSLYFAPADAGPGLLPWSHVEARMRDAKNYWIATAARDGRPHAMPVWGVWQNGSFWFSTSPLSRKARNLDASPLVSLHLESGDDVVVIEGVAERTTDPARLQAFVDAYNPKYSWSFSVEELAQHCVFAVRPCVAFAWCDSRNPGFAETATRWEWPRR